MEGHACLYSYDRVFPSYVGHACLYSYDRVGLHLNSWGRDLLVYTRTIESSHLVWGMLVYTRTIEFVGWGVCVCGGEIGCWSLISIVTKDSRHSLCATLR